MQQSRVFHKIVTTLLLVVYFTPLRGDQNERVGIASEVASIIREFTCPQILKTRRDSDSPKPAIFAMSNPTLNAECTAADAFKHAGENIVFASGNPFPNVDLGKFSSDQCLWFCEQS
ncbi:hypothetical protein MLD38_024103 [Melastoma candidum]|uniref:Uncharacterized protein n=1 Tax=Melastoma candidum TaxID=119954 RepID=A0ACB9NRD7_9MYRT|nr:hypothetical protein MLD38_024103 [Melastoma candidum]